MVGRAKEITALQGLLGQGGQGSRVVQILGEPGIGKSRLLAEFREQATRGGALVLAGRGSETRQAPYGLFIDALDGCLTAADLRRSYGGELPDSLVPVFPSLVGRYRAEPVFLAAERFHVHRAVKELLEELDTGSRLVVVLDDVHWADDGSIELIEYLVRHPPQRPLALMLAYRPRQAPSRLEAVMAGADTAATRPERIELGPLSASAVAELCGPGTSPLKSRQIHEASGGNPLYVQALLRSGDQGGLSGSPDSGFTVDQASLALPLSVRAVVLDELREAGEDVRVVAQAAAVLDDPFDAEMTGVVAEVDEAGVLSALDELTRRDLVRPAGSVRSFEFRHPLVRTAVYQATAAGWRLGAHARAAKGLALRGAPPFVQAPHVERSARAGDEYAVALLAQAADDVASTAPALSARWAREAARLLPHQDPRRSEFLLREAIALGSAGHLPQSRDALHGLASSVIGPSHPRRTQAVLGQAVMERLLGRFEQAATLLLRELEGNTGLSAAQTAMLEIQVAAVELRRGDFSQALIWGHRALLSAQRAHEPVQVAGVHGLLALTATSTGDQSEALGHLDVAITTLDDTEDRQLLEHLDALMLIGWTEILQRRHAAALRHLERGLTLVRHAGRNYLLTDLLAATAFAHLGLGHLSEAVSNADDALEAALLLGTEEPRALALAANAAVSMWRGEFIVALKICEEAVAPLHGKRPSQPMVAMGMLGQARLWCGDPTGCVNILLEAGGGPELPRLEAPERPSWFRTLVHAALAYGDTDAAQEWARCAARSVVPDHPQAVHALALLAHAEAALSLDNAGAARAALEAAGAFATAGMPLYEASARTTAAQALASLGNQSASHDQEARAQLLFNTG